MSFSFRSAWLVAGIVLATSLAAAAQEGKPLNQSDMVSSGLLVTRIDANCAVVKSAVAHEAPTEIVRSAKTTWKVVPTAMAVVAERKRSTSHARIWKQAGNYVWAHWVERNAQNAEHVDQFCFRNDGTLARVRQATTVPALDSAVAREAYFNRDGSLIKRTTAFAVNDPVIYKRVRDLPFYSLLP